MTRADNPSSQSALKSSLRFLEGGGEMGGLIRSHAWDKSALGSPEAWPAPLRTALRLMLNTSHPMYIWWGSELLCFYNDAYRASIGPERHPCSLGQPGREVWEEIWPIIGPQIAHVREGRGSMAFENALVPITRNGVLEDVYWTYSYNPIDDESAPHGVGGVLVICSETTAQLAAEAKLREADKRKDEFLATLAHELRNPLAPIRNAAKLLRTPTADAKTRDWATNVIDRQIHNMASLLDDLLDVSRITRGQININKQPTLLSSIVETSLEVARPLIDARQHNVQIDLPETLIELDVDPLRMSQVLTNLLTNAAKYSEPGGQIKLSATIDGQSVRIKVKDSGIGLEPESLTRIFVMFSQVSNALDRSEGGLGIGLALVKGLVELHGGEVSAASEGLGQGSEFSVRLPLAKAAQVKK
jgi:signal transduction histidine kinase